MSRFRNRNLRNKFFIPPATAKRRESERTVDSGIDVKPVHGDYNRRLLTPSSSSGSDIEIIDEDRGESLGKNSSASSLSWGEDYEYQATELVREEYERMERVLQGVEPIPPHYDRDEYKLWIRTFPYLSLLGTDLPKRATQQLRQISSEDVPDEGINPPSLLSNLSNNCDKPTSESENNLTVINKLIDDLYPTNNRRSSTSTTFSNNKELAVNQTLNPRTLDVAFGSFLQIAPLVIPPKQTSASSRRKTPWHDNLFSTNSTTRSNLSESKRPPTRRKLSSQISQTNSDFIVLPPIDLTNSNYTSSRSVSAQAVNSNKWRKTSSDVSTSQPLFEEMSVDGEDSFRKTRVAQKRRSRFVNFFKN